MRIPTLTAIALFSIHGILHGQPLGAPVSFEFSGSLQQVDGEAGFQIGQSGDIISQLTYEVDATMVGLTARAPLSPAIWLRGELATSLSGDGESEDLDWENGTLTDVSISQSDVDLSSYSILIAYSLAASESLSLGWVAGYAAFTYDFSTFDTHTTVSYGEDVDDFDEGNVSTYEVEFSGLEFGAFVDASLAEKLLLHAEILFTPSLSAESSALWILRDYPFEQEADGIGLRFSLTAEWELRENMDILFGLRWADFNTEDGTESGIADGVEPYSDEAIVPEITGEYSAVEVGLRIRL